MHGQHKTVNEFASWHSPAINLYTSCTASAERAAPRAFAKRAIHLSAPGQWDFADLAGMASGLEGLKGSHGVSGRAELASANDPAGLS